MIKTIGLSKIFRTESVQTTALNEVSLEINQGEFVAIMGPSGCVCLIAPLPVNFGFWIRKFPTTPRMTVRICVTEILVLYSKVSI